LYCVFEPWNLWFEPLHGPLLRVLLFSDMGARQGFPPLLVFWVRIAWPKTALELAADIVWTAPSKSLTESFLMSASCRVESLTCCLGCACADKLIGPSLSGPICRAILVHHFCGTPRPYDEIARRGEDARDAFVHGIELARKPVRASSSATLRSTTHCRNTSTRSRSVAKGSIPGRYYTSDTYDHEQSLPNRCARDSPFFTQDYAINLNPSPSGSLRTSQGVSKYMVDRCSAVYEGQCGSPS
jgi:hypothetical protein